MKSFNSITFFSLFLVLCAVLVNSTMIGIPYPLPPCSSTNSTNQPCIWETVNKNSIVVKIVVISPLLGSVVDKDLLDLVVKAQLLGISVFAKIQTNLGKRALIDVKADIDLCLNLYGIDGIFFDEIPTDCSCQPYFAELYAYVKVKVAGLVVLNVKANVPECFGLFADILVVVDLTLTDYLNYVPLPWFKKYPTSTFWHVIRGCPPEQQRAALVKATKLGAGLVYITADVDVDLNLGSGDLLTLHLDLLVRLLKLLNLDLFLNLKL